MNLDNGRWLNKPNKSFIDSETVEITTEPGTDLWQKSYYGFQNDNAHALVFTKKDNFTFTTHISFDYRELFDQCGLLVYLDCDNWFKASIEYDNKHYSRLGSVVTNFGYSDWATQDIATITSIWYRLSRRGPDFRIEYSRNGKTFMQMRIFHLHCLGETSREMAKAELPLPTEAPVSFGFYACSPLDSSFSARFDRFYIENCIWKAHNC